MSLLLSSTRSRLAEMTCVRSALMIAVAFAAAEAASAESPASFRASIMSARTVNWSTDLGVPV